MERDRLSSLSITLALYQAQLVAEVMGSTHIALACHAIDLHHKVTSYYGDKTIQWKCMRLIDDFTEAESILHCCMRKENIRTIADKLWPKMLPKIGEEREAIQCRNRYRVHYETGILLILVRFARPVRYRPELERMFGLRKSHLPTASSLNRKAV